MTAQTDHTEDGFELAADQKWMTVWFTRARMPMLDELKEIISPMARRWLPTEKLWYIRLAQWSTALKIFQRHGLFLFAEPHDANHRLGKERRRNGGTADRAAWEREEAARKEREREQEREKADRERTRRQQEEWERTRRQQGGWDWARRQQSAPPPKAAPVGPWRTLYLMEGAPPKVVTAAYRALAFLYHPDRNKNADAEVRMKALNEAYEKLPHD